MAEIQGILDRVGLTTVNSGAWARTELDTSGGEVVDSINPATGKTIASVSLASVEQYEEIVDAASDAFQRWRMLPAPKRGEIVREIGNALRTH